MLNRYLCGDVGLTDGDFEFGLEVKIWTGDVNMGMGLPEMTKEKRVGGRAQD